MENPFINIVQIILGISVFYVWIFRYKNVVNEFKQFGLSELTRNFVGAAKMAVSTLIIASIWIPSLVQIPAILLGLFMIAAQYFHFKANNPFIKHLPSLILLALAIMIVFSSM